MHAGLGSVLPITMNSDHDEPSCTNIEDDDGDTSESRMKRQKTTHDNFAADDIVNNANELADGSQCYPPYRRYMMTVAYDGTRFKGFQRQTSSSSAQQGQQGTATADETANTVVDKKTFRKNKVRRHDGTTGKMIAVSVTVQEFLEDAFEMFASSLSRQRWDRDLLRMRFAGRTDAGVHARGQVIAVNLPLHAMSTTATTSTTNNENTNDEELWRIRRAINSRLPVDVSIESVQIAPHDHFDPRKEAVRKRYSYTIRYRRQVFTSTDSNEQKQQQQQRSLLLPICTEGGPNLLRNALDPMNGRCWIIPWALDDSKLEEYCEVLTGTHDFSAFVHKSSREQHQRQQQIDGGGPHRTVDILTMERIQTTEVDGAPVCDVRFTTEAKGFGRNQVRYMIGFLVDLCRGDGGALVPDVRPTDGGDKVASWLWNEEQDYEMLAARIQKAAPCGLVLEKVFF
jgi:tRNA pseudouridine(38-40) synthase